MKKEKLRFIASNAHVWVEWKMWRISMKALFHMERAARYLFWNQAAFLLGMWRHFCTKKDLGLGLWWIMNIVNCEFGDPENPPIVRVIEETK